MRILMVGSGGREHALIRKLKESPRCEEIYCAPGNGGISKDAVCVDISAEDIDGIAAFAKAKNIDLVFVAPDDPLAAGMVDALEQAGIRAFGPRKNAAVIESSKVFSKNLMKKYGIPTAGYEVFSEPKKAIDYITAQNKFPVVVKADGLALWTLRNDKGRCWLPLFTSVAAAGADRSTGSRPMADRTLEQAMQLALDTPGIDGVVLDPWSNSASLDGALLNGLLHAGHTPEGPGAEEAEAGKEAARAGHWAAAAECYQKAAEQGSSAGLSLLGECLYQGRGVPKSAAQARKLWKAAAESGEPIALLNLGDDCAARGDNGKALLWYRRAWQNAASVPDIEYTPRVCLRLAQYETRYTSRKKALAQAAEAKQAFTILQREHEPDADRWLQEAEQLLYALTHEPPTAPAAYNIESLQLD